MIRRPTGAFALILLILAAGARGAEGEVRLLALGGFAVQHEVVVPGTPEEAYDAFTGDVTGWWDQTFSKNPRAIVIEPRPGGGFFELFDDAGNGALHATVIFAQRGQRLRFRGQMGYSGFPVDMVHTVDFLPADAQTRVLLGVNAVGQLKEGWAEGVDQVWRHLLLERFKPYMEALQAARGEGGQEGGAAAPAPAPPPP